jgi:cystathionine beta-synthase
VEQTGGQLDFVVLTAGTGGTITGVAQRMRQDVPGCKVVGVDPEGSILAGPGPLASYKIEGIGYDFIPDVLDRDLVDEWVKTRDRESFLMARRLIRQEGLLVGGSSGSAVWAAVEIAKREGPGKRIVTLLPDSVRNYMTKFLDDAWMRENGFTESLWETSSLGELLRSIPRRELVTASSADTVGGTIAVLKEKGISQVPVVDEGRLAGIVTESDLLRTLLDGHATPQSKVAEVMYRNVETVHVDDDAGVLSDLFAKDLVAIVVDDEGGVAGLLSPMDLVEHLTRSPART